MKVSQQLAGLVIFLLACFIAAWLGSLATTPKIDGWYNELQKPSWTPPNNIFGPVWGFLYAFMALAAWMVWRRTSLVKPATPMILFILQLALNIAWSWLFFGMESPGIAMVDIVALWFLILATLIAFWKTTPISGILFIPYIIWVTYAAALNFAVWQMNG